MPGQPRGWAGATQLGGLTTLECQFQTSLHDAGRNRTWVCDLTETCIRALLGCQYQTSSVIRDGGIRRAKAGRVECVEHLPAELQTEAFANIPILRDASIHGPDRWT